MPKNLGEFEVLILLSLVRLGKEGYGARIQEEIDDRTGRSAAIGAVYTGLARLRKRGLVTATLGEPTPERGGRRKKLYHLTPQGKMALARAVRTHRRMVEGIELELDRLVEGTEGGSAT